MKAGRFLLAFLALAVPQAAFADEREMGREVYEQHCLACHQSKGGGVPFFQPPLQGSRFVTGGKEPLIRFVLEGSGDLDHMKSTYENIMPGFGELDDEELAAVLSYIRNAFGNEASEVSTDEVSSMRSGY